MKKIGIIVVLFFGAIAYSHAGSIDNHGKRIHKRVHTNRLTHRSTHWRIKQDRKVKMLKIYYASDGIISPGEHRRISKVQKKLNRQIFFRKHNGQMAYRK